MALFNRHLVLLPVVLALISFVLTSLTLFAGHKQGFMEDYAIIRINTSRIGHNLLEKRDVSQPKLLADLQGWLDDKKDGFEDKVRGKINDGVGRLTDKLVSRLHLAQWYSLHIMDACEGTYSPNFTAPGAKVKTTRCTTSDPSNRLNLTRLVDSQLDLGPLHLSLADMGWSDSVQDKIDGLNDALTGLFVVYVLAMGCSGLSMLASMSAFFMPAMGILTLSNMAIGSLGGLSCLIGSIIVTATASKAAKHINSRGVRFGISAERGVKFYTISWVATAFMLTVAAFWLAQYLSTRRHEPAPEMSEKRRAKEEA
ncbi:SUR7 protein [Ophiocordyceps camponoti-floridani]|uniref:SUR7 protein n=1 Tax=Ophiocordyceps camponoti-floridani TaxID=2030778 RepID=A0A8H4Q634_9HYPO|nr:SUR7 protein [Ophiocordyceps camponoti-floridani]